jgi:hypothetical protein
MRPFLILFIFSAIQSSGQKASFKEIKLRPNSKYYNAQKTTIIFPIVATKNPKIDALINSQIKEDLFQLDNGNQSLKSALNEHINEYGLINLSYQVTYNSSGFLSLSIYTEGCGAYCSSSNSYFNFDLLTGKEVSIYDMFLKDKIDSFKNIVQSDKINLLTKYKIEEKDFLLNSQIDSATYDWVISQVDDNCINQFSIERFSISSNSIQIIDPCEFPHAIQSQEPLIELKYPYNSIAKFLAPKFKKILK